MQANMDDPRLMRLYEIIEGRLPIVIHTGDYRYDYSHQPRDARPAKNNFFDFNAKKSAIMRVLKC